MFLRLRCADLADAIVVACVKQANQLDACCLMPLLTKFAEGLVHALQQRDQRRFFLLGED
jgi:hypothetical protein